MESTYIYIKTQFEGLHRYKNAPEEVDFLKHFHRHIFKVTVKIEVFDDDRELEFIMVKRQLDKYLNQYEPDDKSCEMIAKDIGRYLIKKYDLYNRQLFIDVSEDGENGSIVILRIDKSYKKNGFLFEGVEVEGKYKGKFTLFVAGDVDFDIIKSYLNKKNYQQIYFGANNQSVVTDYEVIKKVKENYPDLIVSLEVLCENLFFIPINILFNKNIHIIITFKNFGIRENMTIKIENDEGIYCFSDYIFNDWVAYKEDKILTKKRGE